MATVTLAHHAQNSYSIHSGTHGNLIAILLLVIIVVEIMQFAMEYNGN